MYQPISFFIGLRYMFGRATDHLDRFVSWLSTIAITLGVMAMVAVLSVMNGFEYELQNNILGLMPQAILLSINGSLDPHQLPKRNIQLYGITRIAPLTIGDVVLQSSNNLAVGLLLGIDPIKEDPLTPYLVNVKQTDLIPGKYNAILGGRLARELGVSCGDQLRVIVPLSSKSIMPIDFLPIQQRLFNVIGIFITNSEIDSYQMLVNIQDASCLMYYPVGHITGWRLWLKDPLKVDKLSQQKLPDGIKWQDWRERKGELFQAVHMEKNVMGLLLGLIVTVATFNIVTLLILKVKKKQNEVAILQTHGLTHYQIMMVFMIQGVGSGVIGALLGTVLGLILANQLNNLIPIIGALLGISLPILPVEINLLQIVSIMLFTIVIALLSTIYPSWFATKIPPVETLRYE